MPSDSGVLKVKHKNRKQEHPTLTEEERAYLFDIANVAMQYIEAKENVVSGEAITQSEWYKNSGKKEVSDFAYSLSGYEMKTFNKKEIKKFLKEKNLKGAVAVDISYIYAYRAGLKDFLNPLNDLKGLGSLLKLYEAKPNSMGISVQRTWYNHKGKTDGPQAYALYLGKGDVIKKPTYFFKLDDVHKPYIEKVTKLAKENVNWTGL